MKQNLIFIFCNLLFAGLATAEVKSPLIIGHRGASGYRPEHTLESYKLAIEMGADFIEPDLVMTKDKVLVARHENEISDTTDVAAKFPARKTTKTVDGKSVTGWFIEDFTLKEIKTLRAKERLEFRDHSYDGKFEIATFADVLDLIKSESKSRKRTIGVYPELKHPAYFAAAGLPMEKAVVAELKKHKLSKKGAAVFLQSFELECLKNLKKLTPVSLVLLIDGAGIEHTKPESLKELSKTVSGIGPYKGFIVPVNEKGEKLAPTNLVRDAHAAGLLVHAYTFRSEANFLLKEYKGDPQAEYLDFFKAGVDGVFSDFPDQAVRAREVFLKAAK